MDKIKYVNHFGESLDLRSTELMSSYVSLKEFVQNMTNGRLVSKSKTTSLPVVCMNRAAANKLIDFLEIDSTANMYGKFFINDWYIEVIYRGLQSIKNELGEKLRIVLTFHSKDTLFTRGKDFILSPVSKDLNYGLNYPKNYNYDFGGDLISLSQIENTELLDADFMIKFTAPASKVNIAIGNNSYNVDFPINSGETFVLNTESKEVYKISAAGKSNLFAATSDTDNIFQTIKKGTHRVIWSGNFPISFRLLEHRRTPYWI